MERAMAASSGGMLARVELSWAQPRLGDIHGLTLVIGVATGDGELVLNAAQLKVVSGQFADEGDLNILILGQSSLDLRGGGLN